MLQLLFSKSNKTCLLEGFEPSLDIASYTAKILLFLNGITASRELSSKLAFITTYYVQRFVSCLKSLWQIPVDIKHFEVDI